MANISTMGEAEYAITAADIVRGFATIPVLWDSPFNDTNYNLTWEIYDESVAVSTQDWVVGGTRHVSPSGFTAVVGIFAAVPLVQAVYNEVAGVDPTPVLSLTAPIQTLYQVTLYYGPSRSDAADAGKTWSPTITWRDPVGNVLIASTSGPTIMLGSAEGGDQNISGNGGVGWLQSYSIPFFAAAGTPITVTGGYTGGAFPMNISIRVVEMPAQSATQLLAGDKVAIHAMASHR
jgi:hypothetical protein